MISFSAAFDRDSRIRQSFDHIPDFQIVLAISIHREPPRRDSVHPIAAYKWIVQALDNFVAERGDILEA